MRIFSLAAMFAVFLCSAASAAEVPPSVSARLAALIPGTAPDRIQASEIPGVFEVWFGPSIYYISADGRYLLRGDLIDLDSKKNLTEGRQAVARKVALKKLDEKGMIIFGSKDLERTVTVFTDIDCPYCAKFHREMAAYNALGVRVRYLAFPRAGIPSKSYSKTVSVWCSDDPKKAIGDAKFGKPVENRTCANPVEDHYNMGQIVGVRGTPTIVMDNGEIIPGYVPPTRLLEILNQADAG